MVNTSSLLLNGNLDNGSVSITNIFFTLLKDLTPYEETLLNIVDIAEATAVIFGTETDKDSDEYAEM